MSLREHLKDNPDFLRRAMKCRDIEELKDIVCLEGIDASPEEIDDVYSLFELGDNSLEVISGGKNKTQKEVNPEPSLPQEKGQGQPLTRFGEGWTESYKRNFLDENGNVREDAPDWVKLNHGIKTN